MAWVYLDDQFPDHPKVVRAGDEAAWLFVCCLAYCKRFNTGGTVPRAQIPKLTGLRSPAALARRLVDVVLLVEDGDDTFRVHDFDDWNKPQESRSAAGRKAARARWDKERNANADAVACEPQCDGDAPGVRDPVPQDAQHPVPIPEGSVVGPPTPSTRPASGGGIIEQLLTDAGRILAEQEATRRRDAGAPIGPGYAPARAPKIRAEHEQNWRRLLDLDPTMTATDLAASSQRPAGESDAEVRARAKADLERSDAERARRAAEAAEAVPMPGDIREALHREAS